MSWPAILFHFLIILSAAYLMTCAGYLILHRYFIIFPSRRLSCVPSDYQMQYDEVFFSTEDRVLLNGWLIKGSSKGKWKDYTVMLFPGNKGTMSDFLLQMKKLWEKGFNIFMFSYRGFGKSQRRWPTEDGVYKDSEAACQYLIGERKTSLKKLIFLGQSLGCAMASRTAQNYSPFALILEGGFPSLVKAASRTVKWLPLSLLTRSNFATALLLKKTGCPVLIIHSTEDRAIPPADAQELFNSVPSLKDKVRISGPHAKGLEYDPENYIDAIDRFLDEISGQDRGTIINK